MELSKCNINATGREHFMILTVCLFQHHVSIWGQNCLCWKNSVLKVFRVKFCVEGDPLSPFSARPNEGVLLVLTDGKYCKLLSQSRGEADRQRQRGSVGRRVVLL